MQSVHKLNFSTKTAILSAHDRAAILYQQLICFCKAVTAFERELQNGVPFVADIKAAIPCQLQTKGELDNCEAGSAYRCVLLSTYHFGLFAIYDFLRFHYLRGLQRHCLKSR